MTEANRIATHVFAIATVRPALMVVGFAAAIWLARCDGQRSAMSSVRLTEAKRAEKQIDSVRVVVRDTIKIREKARQHWDTVVRNVSDTQVVIQRERPETVTVAREVIQRDRAKDSLVTWLYAGRRVDSLLIDTLRYQLKLPKPTPRYSLGINAGYACNPKGCGPGLSVGLNIKVP